MSSRTKTRKRHNQAQNRKPPACRAFRRPAVQFVNEPRSLCARRRKESPIIFSGDMCGEENTARPANVRAVRLRRTARALQSGRNPFCQKVILFDSLSRRPAEHSAGRPFFIRYHKTISSVPAPMSKQPIRDLGVKRSCRNMNASTSVMTTLSLSIGTTFDASPICSAR